MMRILFAGRQRLRAVEQACPGLAVSRVRVTTEHAGVALDPDLEPGRVTLIHRMGHEIVAERLPALVEAVLGAGRTVLWCCDPMHGNTYTNSAGRKTRHFDAVLAEIEGFVPQRTWDYDFTGSALADKRFIARLRAEKGRWVDYVIEFARGIDNRVGYHGELSRIDRPRPTEPAARMNY